MTGETLQTAAGSFRVRVEGPAGAPALVLSNSLGTTLEMWDAQAERFARTHRVVRYDTRGHGGSVVSPGPYTFDQLGGDVVALLDALGIARASFCGISMGGLTGLWLGVNAPQRLERLVVANSAAKIGTADGWAARAALVREKGAAGMAELAASAPGRWFTDAFAAAQPEVVRRAQGWWPASRRKAMPPAAKRWRRPTCAARSAPSACPRCSSPARPTRSPRWRMRGPCRPASLARSWPSCRRRTCRTSKRRRLFDAALAEFLQRD